MNKYINQDRALKILERTRDHCSNDDMAFALNWAVETVKTMPNADVEDIVHGEWIRHIDCGMITFECSECTEKFNLHNGTQISEIHYCPNCGAKMDKEEEECFTDTE